MKNILTLLLFAIAFKTIGQNQLVEVAIGPSWTNAQSKDLLKENRNTKVGILIAIGYTYQLKNFLSFGAGFQYNQRGYTDTAFAFDGGTGQPVKHIFKVDYDYLSIPIKSGLNMGSRINGFVNLGVVPSILIKARFEYPLNNESDVTDQVNKFDFAGLIEIGGSYKFNSFYLFTSLSYQQSFTSMTNDSWFQNADLRHSGITYSIGLKYTLVGNNSH